MPRGAILFDFDGTLVDTRQASWEVFAETNERFGLGVDSRDEYFRIFQNNFYESFAALSSDAEKIRQAKEHFIAALNERYRPSLIPGIVDVIRSLTPGYTLAVVSSNAMPVIRRVLIEAGIATCFSHVFSGDVQTSKSAVIEQFTADQSYASLRHCSPSYVDTTDVEVVPNDATFMVTDTVGDVEEARRAGVRAVGVCWGMHDEASLLAAGAETVMVWPQELISFFGAATDDLPDTCRLNTTSSSSTTPVAAASNQASPAEVRSENRLRIRQTAATDPNVSMEDQTSAPATRMVESVVGQESLPSLDPELIDALRLTAVP